MPKENKADRAVIRARIDYMYELLCKGHSQRSAVQHAAAFTEWGQALTKRQLRNYVYKARDSLSNERRKIDRTAVFMTLSEQVDIVIRETLATHNYDWSLKALKFKASLYNVNASDALVMSWRDEIEAQGGDASAIFEELVQHASKGMNDVE